MLEVNEHTDLVLTSENPDCYPSRSIYSQQESAMANRKGETRTRMKPNWEVLSVEFPFPPKAKDKNPDCATRVHE